MDAGKTQESPDQPMRPVSRPSRCMGVPPDYEWQQPHGANLRAVRDQGGVARGATMMTYPKTRAEAEAYRYNRWGGNPGGRAFNPMRCAMEGFRGIGWQHQCSHKPGKGPGGLYCGQHAKMVK